MKIVLHFAVCFNFSSRSICPKVGRLKRVTICNNTLGSPILYDKLYENGRLKQPAKCDNTHLMFPNLILTITGWRCGVLAREIARGWRRLKLITICKRRLKRGATCNNRVLLAAKSK
jgi:hypothetical protein